MSATHTLPAPSTDRLPIRNKRQFVELYKQGVFGNASPTWDTFQEYWDSGYKGLIHFRNRITAHQTWYNVQRCDAQRLILAIKGGLFDGLDESHLYFSAMAPHHLNLLQGEVMRTHEGLYLRYSTERDKPMRDVLFEDGSKHAYRSVALMLLQATMNVDSYEWLMALLDWYPDHVVEISVFDKCWGTVPGHNTVFWEVRGGY